MYRCLACHHTIIGTLEERIALLRSQGKLLRDKQPDPAIVDALLPPVLPNVSCSNCGQQGLEEFSDNQAELNDEDWGEARRCAGCGTKIDPERLELLPDTRQCTACSAAGRTGQADEREFCHRCGDELKLVARGGAGLAGYRMRCPSCG